LLSKEQTQSTILIFARQLFWGKEMVLFGFACN